MCKKSLMLIAMFLITLTSAFAQSIFRPIVLQKKGGSVYVPSIKPFSLDESADFTAFFDDEQLVVSSTENATVYINVSSSQEVVSSNHVSLSAGAEYSIDITDWTPGTYTLYILCNGDMWVGEFEIE